MKRAQLSLLLAALANACHYEGDYLRYNTADFLSAPVPWDDTQADIWLPVVAICSQCDRDPEVNRSRMASTVEQVMTAHPDARLLLFGETITGWYWYPPDPRAYIRSLAEPRDGPTMVLVRSLAQRYNTTIAYGYAESAGDQIFNATAVIAPSGALLANHRKIHLTDPDLAGGYSPGREATTFILDGIEIGILICMDHLNLILAQRYARDNIKVIINPLGDVVPEDIPFNYVSRLYQKWFVTANRWGEEPGGDFNGACGIADPAGGYRAQSFDAPGFLYHRLGIYR